MIERIIIPVGYGRTCNQLFQISHWLPTAIELDVPLYFPGFSKYIQSFKGTKFIGDARFPILAPKLSSYTSSVAQISSLANRVHPFFYNVISNIIKTQKGNVSFELDDSGRDGFTTPGMVIENVINAKTIWIKGWLYRDPEGVRKHYNSIRDFFAPLDSIAYKIDSLNQTARQNVDILVGVHIRRGDYRKFNGGMYFFDDVAFANFLKQTEALLFQFRVRFLLVSNEYINIENFKDFNIILGIGDAIGDLYSLSKCDYIIGPPSTYTAWASWYQRVPRYEMLNTSQRLTLEEFIPVLD